MDTSEEYQNNQVRALMSPNKYQGKNITKIRRAAQNISLRHRCRVCIPFDRYNPMIRVKKKNTSYLKPRKADSFISKMESI